MHVKRLYRPTVREALAAARQELGPGALVLSTELVPAAGWRGWMGKRHVRLTAAAERPIEADQPVQEVSVERSVTAHRHAGLTGVQAGVAARLCAVGLHPALADAVAARLTPSACRGGSPAALRRALAAEIETRRGDDAEFARYEVFVGPPGVGKTTTIAKIAAQERVRGGRPLALVAADAFRAGAVEQLCCYAMVMGLPIRVVRDAAGLDHALTAARHTALVDMAGRSPADASVTDLLEVLGRRRDVRTHLVLAADTKPAIAERIFDQYANVKASRVVITKLDEADSVVPLFNVVRERGLPVSYVAAGQRVPEDLQRATPAFLAATLLEGQEAATSWR